jgi:hypothetical protein
MEQVPGGQGVWVRVSVPADKVIEGITVRDAASEVDSDSIIVSECRVGEGGLKITRWITAMSIPILDKNLKPRSRR